MFSFKYTLQCMPYKTQDVNRGAFITHMSTTEVVEASPSTLELNAHLDSKITAVTLYPNRADITRSFRCELKPGLTQVRIPTGFPSSFDGANLR